MTETYIKQSHRQHTVHFIHNLRLSSQRSMNGVEYSSIVDASQTIHYHSIVVPNFTLTFSSLIYSVFFFFLCRCCCCVSIWLSIDSKSQSANIQIFIITSFGFYIVLFTHGFSFIWWDAFGVRIQWTWCRVFVTNAIACEIAYKISVIEVILKLIRDNRIGRCAYE